MILALFGMSLYVHLNCPKIISENISITEGRKLVSVYVVVVVYEYMGNVCSQVASTMICSLEPRPSSTLGTRLNDLWCVLSNKANSW